METSFMNKRCFKLLMPIYTYVSTEQSDHIDRILEWVQRENRRSRFVHARLPLQARVLLLSL